MRAEKIFCLYKMRVTSCLVEQLLSRVEEICCTELVTFMDIKNGPQGVGGLCPSVVTSQIYLHISVEVGYRCCTFCTTNMAVTRNLVMSNKLNETGNILVKTVPTNRQIKV